VLKETAMARPPSSGLTDAELRVMRVLWAHKRATVGGVVANLPGTHTLAYNTVLTTLGILERKGYVAHEKDGRAYAYRPIVNQSEARHSALSQILNRFFDDSPRLLVLDLLGHERTDVDELRRLRELIEQAPPDAGPGAPKDVAPKRRRRR
jgi:predicted transcriptional regulator